MSKLLKNGITDAYELSEAKRQHRLPENLSASGDKFTLTKRHAYLTALAYLLADVSYTVMFDLCAELLKHGKDLRHETKRRLNEFYRTAKQFGDAARRVSQDVAGIGENAMLDYVDDSDVLRELIELLYDRLHATDDAPVRIRALLFNLPSNHIYGDDEYK